MTGPSDPAHPNWPLLREDPEQPWQTLHSETVIGGARQVNVDQVQASSGAQFSYLYRPRGPRAVFVLPVTASGEAVLIREYRYPLRATITQVVAGGVESGEALLQSAQRELAEEAGGVGGEWLALPAFYPQPSISGVVFYPFLALNVTLQDAQPEHSETIERLLLPLPEVYRRLEAGEIHDGPSSLVLWHARAELSRRGLL